MLSTSHADEVGTVMQRAGTVHEHGHAHERVLYAVRARCVHWGDFVDLPTYSAVKCMCFQAVEGIALDILHCVLLQFHPCLFHGFLPASLSRTPDQMVIGCLPPSSPPPTLGSP